MIPSFKDIRFTVEALLADEECPLERDRAQAAFNGVMDLKPPRFHRELKDGKYVEAEPQRYDLIFSGDHSILGVILNHDSGACRLEGCRGHRMYVKWSDGTVTYPCSKGVSSVCVGLYEIG